MKRIKLVVTTLAISALLQGCAIKKNDSTFMKTIKHTANSPMYVVVGAGALVVGATVIAATAATSLATGTANAVMGSDAKATDAKATDAKAI